MSNRELPAAQAALWAGALAIINGLPKETGGTSRQIGEFTEDGARTTATSTYKVAQPDGTTKVYTLTLAVEQSVDEHDGRWGPDSQADRSRPGARVVVDAHLYEIGSASAGGFRGFSGRRFDIEFFDGRTATTRNRWDHGVIPPKWRERYPDNARFVQPEGGAL
ncbi:hypothetical protein [Streptosporangium sp. V21-05]|uniref:hypothetical protein n=1 Tax=Streptosporangium sp. V21-05 TaxID=3446115 RepID=UPI003F539F46